MNNLLIFVLLFLGNILHANELRVDISSKLLKLEHTDPHYICLGNWENFDTKIHNEVSSLKNKYPTLFSDLDINSQNCISPMQIPAHSYIEFDHLLSTIDLRSKDELYGKIDASGSFVLKNQNEVLLRKFGRATMLTGSVHIVELSLLAATPGISRWEGSYFSHAKSNLKRAWTRPPVIDKDGWAINYLGHPYTGSLYYNALRSQGATRIQSFLFSTLQSTIWEYTIEALAEQPSIQDLIATPVIGSIMGELANLATVEMRKNNFNLFEKILVTVINPAFALNNGFKTKQVPKEF